MLDRIHIKKVDGQHHFARKDNLPGKTLCGLQAHGAPVADWSAVKHGELCGECLREAMKRKETGDGRTRKRDWGFNNN